MNQFIFVENVPQLRNLSVEEIAGLESGQYLGVTLLGYYVKDDTPYPINYFLTDTIEEDDGGSVFNIGGIKLKHNFEGQVDVQYFGAVANALVDNAGAITKCIEVCLSVSISKSYYISADNDNSGIQLKSNSKLVFNPLGEIVALPSSSPNYRLLNIYNIRNVRIVNPRIVGERVHHVGISGEWGHGISITNSEDIVIENPVISNCWGDGIYIGNQYWDATSTISTNKVTINNAFIDNVRRNGISITSTKNVTLNNPRIFNTNGAAPEAGIDIEPEGLDGMPIVIDKIVINDPLTSNNFGSGIMLFFTNDITIENNPNIDISISKHIDDSSKHGFFIPNVRDGLVGSINLLNPVWQNNKQGALLISNFGKEGTLALNILNPILTNWNTSRSDFFYYRNGINIIKEDPVNAYRNVGINIHNLTIRKTEVGDDTTIPIVIDSTNPNTKSIYLSILDSDVKYIQAKKGLVLSDIRNILKGFYWETSTAVQIVTYGRFYTVYTNLGLSGNPIYYIRNEQYTEGQRISFLVESSNWMTIVSDANNILPNVVGGNLSSREIGSKLTLEYHNNYWFIAEQIGQWTNTKRANDMLLITPDEPLVNLKDDLVWINPTNKEIKVYKFGSWI
jgi:hypothetical protein